ncbi:MAG: methylated-DNA--[protein]-cysteine S-methyltransferase [Chloroflexi bacterium OHK40]
MELTYTSLESPLGRVLLAASCRGICWLGIGDTDAALLAVLRADWPSPGLRRDDSGLAYATDALGAYLAGCGPCATLPLDLAGTPFQRRVWAALRAIPYGETRTYRAIAESLGLGPGAARAVGGAGAANPVSLLVPCHRAVGSDGTLRGFRWSVARKAWLLALERRSTATG